MKQQLIQYVELLFAGAPDSEEIKQEILQNTLDRYDDLIAQGKSPEAAYRLAISGIGDINEILSSPFTPAVHPVREAIHQEVEDIQRKKMRAVAIAMYILSPIPLFILSEVGVETIGLCMTLLLVAAATALIIITNRKSDDEPIPRQSQNNPRSELHKSIDSLVWAIGLVIYFVLSFSTGAWYITWVIFPIIGCVQGLIKAIFDLKEAIDHEN